MGCTRGQCTSVGKVKYDLTHSDRVYDFDSTHFCFSQLLVIVLLLNKLFGLALVYCLHVGCFLFRTYDEVHLDDMHYWSGLLFS